MAGAVSATRGTEGSGVAAIITGAEDGSAGWLAGGVRPAPTTDWPGNTGARHPVRLPSPRVQTKAEPPLLRATRCKTGADLKQATRFPVKVPFANTGALDGAGTGAIATGACAVVSGDAKGASAGR